MSLAFEYPEEKCYACKYFTSKPSETPDPDIILNWPTGWCRFNMYITDELHDSCRAFRFSQEAEAQVKFLDMLKQWKSLPIAF